MIIVLLITVIALIVMLLVIAAAACTGSKDNVAIIDEDSVSLGPVGDAPMTHTLGNLYMGDERL